MTYSKSITGLNKIMEKQLLTLDAVKFQDIYTSEKFRNEVAFAHSCCNQSGQHLHYKSCSYPVAYIVTEEQVNEAKNEFNRAKKDAIKNLDNKLVFVGMGMEYTARFNDDVCNHRMRTTFKNKDGKTFFIEVGTGLGDLMRIDFAIDIDLQNDCNKKIEAAIDKRNSYKLHSNEWFEAQKEVQKYQGQPYYNYAGLERSKLELKYTLTNVLELVNKYFDCHFTSIEVDNYTLSPDDFICISPKYAPLRGVSVTYADGTVINTSMAANLTDAQIHEYFKIGSWFNIGSVNDNMQQVQSVQIIN